MKELSESLWVYYLILNIDEAIKRATKLIEKVAHICASNWIPVKDNFDKVEVNTTAAREHVAEIERGIRHVKEQGRCVISDLCTAGF